MAAVGQEYTATPSRITLRAFVNAQMPVTVTGIRNVSLRAITVDYEVGGRR